MLYFILRDICKVLFRIWFKVVIIGKENVPDKGGYIIIANHQNYLDPIYMSFGLKRQIRFMGKAELFRTPVLKWIYYGIGGFPVERGKGDNAAIDKSLEIIKSGQILGMFPEGTRSKDGEPLRAKSGVALISNATNADILPCGLRYSRGIAFRSQVTISYGELIPYEDLKFTDERGPREIKYATKYMFSKVLNLIGKGENNDNSM